MSISLGKGGNISLSKEEPGLTKIYIGLGWDARATDGADFDLDASAFLLNAEGRVRSDADFIFYGQMQGLGGAITHSPDNLDGEGDGDDEWVKVDLTKVPSDVQKIAVTVTIHDAEARRQNFGMVQNAFVRIATNDENGREITRYDLSEDFSVETALIFGEVYRHNAEWKFRAVGQGYKGGLAPLCRNYGVNVG
jgi:tellurium resistance protein TerD